MKNTHFSLFIIMRLPYQIMNDKSTTKYVCVLDFEANCANNMKELGMDNEVIEFPSVLWKIEGQTITKIDEFQVYCKPKNTPKLTQFCTDLTGITQDKVDAGVSFPEALKQHELWLTSHIDGLNKVANNGDIVIMTCGNWDMETMAPKEYANWDIRHVSKVYKRFVNIKKEFVKHYGRGTKAGMVGLLSELGLPLDGRHHSGIDDCKNISKVLCKMIEDGAKYENFTIVEVDVGKFRK